MDILSHPILALGCALCVTLYIITVGRCRYQRCKAIQSRFKDRPLSSMTVAEAHQIVRELRELEFPYSMHNAMKLSLLKTGSIPTMTKLFSATRQLNAKNSPKRAADTEVVLIEVHDRLPGSEMHLRGIARMNYLHARYRRAGKILDEDMLHTLGSAVVDIFHAVDSSEWRTLTDVERCAVGVFHKALGDAMDIPFAALPSYESGWRDGAHFAQELCDWVERYESVAVRPAESNRLIGGQLMELRVWKFPRFLKPFGRRVIAAKLERHMRVSMGFPEPGVVVIGFVGAIVAMRQFVLRYFALPRDESRAVRVLKDTPDPVTGRYTIDLWIAHPWYVKPTFGNRWGLKAITARLFGDGAIPGDEYGSEGYDLRTIEPVAQEKRGTDETEAIYAELAQRDYAGGCPFHRTPTVDS